MISIRHKAVSGPFDANVVEQRLRRGEKVTLQIPDGILEMTLETAADGEALVVFAVTKEFVIIEAEKQNESTNDEEPEAELEELEEVSRISAEAREHLREGQQRRRRREAKQMKEERETLM